MGTGRVGRRLRRFRQRSLLGVSSVDEVVDRLRSSGHVIQVAERRADGAAVIEVPSLGARVLLDGAGSTTVEALSRQQRRSLRDILLADFIQV